jgi:2-C-methyl-D-erythritol 4-phosphate cytidylyltransferase
MGGEIPKQFRDWGGMCVLEATIRAFLKPDMPNINRVVLTVPKDRIKQVNSWHLDLHTQVIAGGNTRQESVHLALKSLPNKPDAIVLIHDAVRPFPPCGPIQLAIESLANWDGAVLGEQSTDTLKRVNTTGQILCTEPRDIIFRAQTPQVARLWLWRKAFEWAQATGFQGTDDASLLEALGKRIKIIISPASNLKLTTQYDWLRAQQECLNKHSV